MGEGEVEVKVEEPPLGCGSSGSNLRPVWNPGGIVSPLGALSLLCVCRDNDDISRSWDSEPIRTRALPPPPSPSGSAPHPHPSQTSNKNCAHSGLGSCSSAARHSPAPTHTPPPSLLFPRLSVMITWLNPCYSPDSCRASLGAGAVPVALGLPGAQLRWVQGSSPSSLEPVGSRLPWVPSHPSGTAFSPWFLDFLSGDGPWSTQLPFFSFPLGWGGVGGRVPLLFRAAVLPPK